MIVADNSFSADPASPSTPNFHLSVVQGDSVQILRNYFDGAWDGVTLQPANAEPRAMMRYFERIFRSFLEGPHITS